MQKTRKCLDIQVDGKHIVCIQDNEKKVYKLYEKRLERYKYGYTERKKLIDSFFMFSSVLCYLTDFAVKNNWGFSFITLGDGK